MRAGQRSAPEIKRLLLEELGESPSERTLQKMVKWASNTPSEPWTLSDADRDEIALIAPVWAVALEYGGQLTKGEADWIVRVRTAVPDLPPDDVWFVATLYTLASRYGTSGPTDVLDAVIAFAPWRSIDHAERYFTAANSGRIPSPSIVWGLALRAFQQEDGQWIVTPDSQTTAFLKNQSKISSTNLGDSVAIEVRPKRKKAGRK